MSHDIWKKEPAALNVKQNIRMDTMLCVLNRAMSMEATPTRHMTILVTLMTDWLEASGFNTAL